MTAVGAAGVAGSTGSAVEAVRRRVAVTVGVDLAWKTLTEGIGSWWPLDVLSCSGTADAVLRFTGDALVETAPGGGEHVWGRLTRWEPPFGLVLAWHPGTDPQEATEVEWRLTSLAGDVTLVEVVHRGWERWVDGAQAAAEYDSGWPAVLAAFAAEADADEPPPVWHILTHSPGPAADTGSAPWEQPWFAGHAGFLDQLKADGALVAAGLLPTGDGSLRSVVRGLDTAEAVRRANEEDPTVLAGYLTVSVAPWLVIARGQLA